VLLNLDAGELPDESPDLWACFDILNIACGGHAGDTASMTRVVQYCASHAIAIGAHPSYPDRDHFGRRSLSLDPDELHASLVAQMRSLSRVAIAHGTRVAYAKPHGALYHDASRDPALAVLVVDAIESALGSPHAGIDRVTIIGPRGHLASAARAAGFAFAVEGFADRTMREDGSLVPRSEPNALITSPVDAAAQARALASGTSGVDTICVHADTPGSLEIARAVRAALAANASAANTHSANLSVAVPASTGLPIATPPPSAESRSATATTSPAMSTSAESRSPTAATSTTASPIATPSTSAESRSPVTTATARFRSESSRPFQHLGDRAIRFPRPPSVSSRALARAVRGWRGVVGVVVTRRDIAAYFAEPILPISREPGVYWNPEDLQHGLRSNIARLAELHDLDTTVREIELRAVYDGPDLDEVARATGLSTDEVIGAHVGATYEVDTLGFAPGFAYLVGLDTRLHLPRRATPRSRVPAGALAIAGEYTAVYPFASPGGWSLIGRVDEPMCEGHRARLSLGDRVRFVR
jgi:KipI family sensor histidine kinase inhibitor